MKVNKRYPGQLSKEMSRYSMYFFINSLWPGYANWRHGPQWKLAQVRVCSLATPSYDLNHCRHITLWTLSVTTGWNLNRNTISFIYEYALNDAIRNRRHFGQWVQANNKQPCASRSAIRHNILGFLCPNTKHVKAQYQQGFRHRPHNTAALMQT